MKKAFTLAEVLITLGIIGVLAAMTLPTIINAYEKKCTVVGLKKAYSLFSEVIKKAELDYGEVSGWDWDLLTESNAGPTNGEAFINKYFIPYMHVDKVLNFYNIGKNLDGSSVSSGTSIYLYTPKYKLTNEMTFSYFGSWGYTDNHSLIVSIDINGFKNPNRMGRDLFVMTISQKKPYLRLGYGNSYLNSRDLLLKDNGDCSKNYKGNGWGCGILIMQDGWKIKDDYPW